MKLLNKKKGFTIVELVIVVAVIGVLTAVLVPTFVNLVNKANEASNQSFVRNLNTAMAMRESEEGKNKTMSEAVEDARAIGFDVEKLTPVNGRDLVWDSVSNRFLLLEQNGDVWYGKEDKKATKDVEIWKIYDAMPETQKYSIYAKSGWSPASATGLTVGFDAGSAVIETVEYVGTQDVAIRTRNDQCVVTINAPTANVDFYGFAKKLDVKAIKGESLHLYGTANQLAVESGHVEIENTGIVFDIVQVGGAATGTGASVTNNGYVGETSLENHTSEAAKEEAEKSTPKNVGGDYAISSREMLEAFRDAVNAGNNFAEFNGVEKKVKLTADITLRDGWTPIGEGSRKVARTGAAATGEYTWFAGCFDGQNHKIINLNNKGFVPNEKRITFVDQSTTSKQYTFGLFGLAANGSKFSNIVFENVNIDGAFYADAELDSAAALVGYAKGGITVKNVTINGKISGADAIAGIVGRITVQDGQIEIDGCTNNANISSGQVSAGIVRLYDWAAGYSVKLTNNTNTGTVTTTSAKDYTAGIAIVTQLSDGTRPILTVSGNTNMGSAAVYGESRIPGTSDTYRIG